MDARGRLLTTQEARVASCNYYAYFVLSSLAPACIPNSIVHAMAFTICLLVYMDLVETTYKECTNVGERR